MATTRKRKLSEVTSPEPSEASASKRRRVNATVSLSLDGLSELLSHSSLADSERTQLSSDYLSLWKYVKSSKNHISADATKVAKFSNEWMRLLQMKAKVFIVNSDNQTSNPKTINFINSKIAQISKQASNYLNAQNSPKPTPKAPTTISAATTHPKHTQQSPVEPKTTIKPPKKEVSPIRKSAQNKPKSKPSQPPQNKPNKPTAKPTKKKPKASLPSQQPFEQKNIASSQARIEDPTVPEYAKETVSTVAEWSEFLGSRFGDNNERSEDWKPPEILHHWSQGPIGMVKEWWAEERTKVEIPNDGEMDADNDELKLDPKELKRIVSAKKQRKAVRKDISKELHRQKVEQSLKERIVGGDVVANPLATADGDGDDNTENVGQDPFVSFFDTALEDFKTSRVNRDDSDSDDEPVKKKKKEKQVQKLKIIASFEKDDLFFIDDGTGNGDEDDSTSATNDEPPTSAEQSFSAMFGGEVMKPSIPVKKKEAVYKARRDENDDNKVRVPTKVLLSEETDDRRAEKSALKSLNVMDYVVRYKDNFFREVEDLGLNIDALIANWKQIRAHESLSRKLKRKLGIIMARERAYRRRMESKQAKVKAADEALPHFLSHSDSESDTSNDDSADVMMGDIDTEKSDVIIDKSLIDTFLSDSESLSESDL